MTNPRLATRYAKSLLDLAVEQDQLDTVYANMKLLKQLMQGNPDFVNMLRSPVISSDKKDKIIEAVIGKSLSKLTLLFAKLLTAKTRESNLPEIVSAFITQYNSMKNIHIVKLTTAAAVSDEVKNDIVSKVKGKASGTIELVTSVDPELIGGFKLETEGTLVDASILRELNEVRRQFLSNQYIQSLR